MDDFQESFVKKANDPVLYFSNKVIVFCVKILAILMVCVIVWGVFLTIYQLYHLILAEGKTTLLDSDTMFQSFGTFLAMLIAIEIFLNIVFYLREDAIHVPLVLGTALTAIARKVIILEYTEVDVSYLFATAALIIAVGISYWLVTKKE